MSARARISGVVALCGGLGCGPELEPLECGERRPAKLLDLAPGERKLHYTFAHDDAWFVGEEAETDFVVRTWAFRCGEVPRVVFDGALGGPIGFGGWWGGSKSLSAAQWIEYVVDPTGAQSPEALPGRRIGVVGDAVVFAATRDGPALTPEPTLTHVTFDDDAPTKSVAIDVAMPDEAPSLPEPYLGQRIVGFDEWAYGWSASDPAVAFANVMLVNPEDDVGVMQVDLATGMASILRRGVRVNIYRRIGPPFLVLQPPSIEDGWMESIWNVETGHELAIGRAGEYPIINLDSTAVVAEYEDETQIILLPEMREIWLQGKWFTEDAVLASDGRRVLFGPEGTYVLEPGADAPTLLDAAWGRARVVGVDVWVEDIGSVPVPDAELPLRRVPYALLRIPLNGEAREEILPAPIHGSLPLTDGRWALIREAEGDDPEAMTGDLVVFDRATGDEQWIASDVSIWFAMLNGRIRSEPWIEPRLAVEQPSEDFVFARWHARDDDDNGIFRVAP